MVSSEHQGTPDPAGAAGAAFTSSPGTLPWLVEIMRKLLGPDGCPWDREQSLESLRPFLLEEAHEVLDALEEGDPLHHREELGDLLFQIVFHAELGGHTMEQVILGIGEKLVRRHPHVFGDVVVADSAQVLRNWERIKQKERGRTDGVLGGVPRSMPALLRALRLTGKAAKVGFDWPEIEGVRSKVAEELAELERALDRPEPDPEEVTGELGDLLFALVNLARHLGLDPEQALRRANERFEARFSHIESSLAQRGRSPEESSLEEMDALWEEAKREQRGAKEGA